MGDYNYNQFVDNVCDDNGITRADLTPENWLELESYFYQNTKKSRLAHKARSSRGNTVTKTGYEAIAEAKGMSIEDIMFDVSEEDNLRRLERTIRLRRATDQYEKLSESDTLMKKIEKEDLLSKRADIDEVRRDITDRNNAVDFLFPETKDFLVLAPGGVTLFCAPTNNGKSTLSCAIAESLIRQGKRVLILSNEEKGSDIRARVSCIRTGISFGAYKQRAGLPDASYNTIIDDIQAIEKQLIVYRNATPEESYRVSNKDGIVKTIEQACGKFDCIIIDYWQRIVKTNSNPEANWEAQRSLAPELDRLKNSVGCPIIVFAQIHPIQKKVESPDQRASAFASNHPYYRWKGSAEILFTATDIVEFAKDFENSVTHLYAHKVRFKHQDWEPYYILGFDRKHNTYYNYDISTAIEKMVENQDGSED